MGYDALRTAARSSPYPSAEVGPTTDSPDADVEDDDVAERRDRIAAFVREAADSSGADGVVVPMSGGVDSTLAAMLATEALGSSRVFGLLLPCNLSDDSANHDAQVIAEALDVEYREIHLRPLLDRFEDLVGPAVEPEDRRRAIGNVLARLRMTSAYYVANATNRLVLGTTNRTEWLLGYFTKHGDGGADLRPLADLYKTELYALAYRMGVPRRIIEKPPTAGLWSGQTDESDLGASYETVDAVLDRYVERGERPAEIAAALEVDVETVGDLVDRHHATAHKRRLAPTEVEGLREILVGGAA